MYYVSAKKPLTYISKAIKGLKCSIPDLRALKVMYILAKVKDFLPAARMVRMWKSLIFFLGRRFHNPDHPFQEFRKSQHQQVKQKHFKLALAF